MIKLNSRRIARLTETLESVRRVWRSQGVLSAVVKLVDFARQLFFRGDCFLYVLSLEESTISAQLLEGLIIKEVQPEDLCYFERSKRPSDVLWYKTLLHKGRRCLLALQDDELAAYGWYTSEVDPVLERTHVPLAKDEILVYDLYTFPAFRRLGIQTALLGQMLQMSRQRGHKRALSLVTVDNVPSQNLHEKMGFKVVSRMTKIRVLGFVRFSYSPNLFGKAGTLIRWL